MGKSRAAISNTLRLFQLPPTVQRMVAEGRLTAGHARALLTTPDRGYQETLAQRIVTDGMSVRAVEEAARQHDPTRRRPHRPPGLRQAPGPSRRLRPPGLLELQELLSAHLDTRVAITMGGSKGAKGKVRSSSPPWSLERIYRAMTSGAPPRNTPTRPTHGYPARPATIRVTTHKASEVVMGTAAIGRGFPPASARSPGRRSRRSRRRPGAGRPR